MGLVLFVSPGLSLRLLGALGFGLMPAANANPTRPGAVFCPSTLDDAAGAIRTFHAALVRTRAFITRLVLSNVRIGFLVGHRARKGNFVFDSEGHDWADLMGESPAICGSTAWCFCPDANAKTGDSGRTEALQDARDIKTECPLLRLGPLDGLFRPVQMLCQIHPAQQHEVLD